jgi:hypothetical protein
MQSSNTKEGTPSGSKTSLNFITNNDSVPTGQPLQLNANHQLGASLQYGMGKNGFIAVDFDEQKVRIVKLLRCQCHLS